MDKRTVRRIVATALAVILAEQVFFLICGFGLPVQFGDTFMGELKSKYERLKETSGKLISVCMQVLEPRQLWIFPKIIFMKEIS